MQIELLEKGQFTIYSVLNGQGRNELLDFLEGLAPNLHKNRDGMLQLLETTALQGPSRNTEISHQIEGEIWEFIKGRLRVFWFYDKNKIIICTHGIVKKTQKISKKDKEKAQQIYSDYMTAKAANRLQVRST